MLYLPFARNTISQPFGANDNESYAESGLKGHTGIDFAPINGFGKPILNCAADAYCFAILNGDDPNLMDYRAVFTLVELPTGTYEVSYGHFSSSSAEIGKTYQVGQELAKIGNEGPVYQNGVLVTEAQKKAGSHAGAHLHLQVRKLSKYPIEVPLDPKAHYVNEYGGVPGMSTQGVLKYNGFYYQVVDFDNGYNGCIDPEILFNDIVAGTVQTVQQPPQNLEQAVNVTVGTVMAEPQTPANSAIVQFLLKLRKILFGY